MCTCMCVCVHKCMCAGGRGTDNNNLFYLATYQVKRFFTLVIRIHIDSQHWTKDFLYALRETLAGK